MNTSLEAAALEIGIDIRRIDMTCLESWQRLPTIAKPGKRNGAAIVHVDGSVVFENWETRETACWRPGTDRLLHPADRSRRAAQIRADLSTRKRHQQQQWADAAECARKIWRRAKPASADHPYLRRKNLPPFDLEETRSINDWKGRWLIAPAYDRDMQVRNLECINEAGDKRPIKGAQRKGLFGLVGSGVPTFHVIIAEGWSTAAALAVSLDQCIVVAYGAGNLKNVAMLWRSMLRNVAITMAADNDASEAGQREAMAAAEAVGTATIKMPTQVGDWCDMYTKYGADVVRGAWIHG